MTVYYRLWIIDCGKNNDWLGDNTTASETSLNIQADCRINDGHMDKVLEICLKVHYK